MAANGQRGDDAELSDWRKRRRAFVRLVLLAGVGVAAWALREELRKPADEREWHGRVLHVVPYDFRAPTPSRMKAAWWNPEDARLLTERPIGIGWTVNLARLLRRGRS